MVVGAKMAEYFRAGPFPVFLGFRLVNALLLVRFSV